MSNRPLNDLADAITTHLKTITQALEEGNIAQPSFEESFAYFTYPTSLELQTTRMALVDSALKLMQLVLGPSQFMTWQAFTLIRDALNWGILDHYGLLEAVPLNGSISYQDLSRKTSLSVNQLMRFIRYSRTYNMFYEPKPGFVGHTSFSAAAAQSDGIKALMGHTFETSSVLWKHVIEALDKYGESQEPNDCAAGLAYRLKDRNQSLWDFLATDGEGEQKGWRMKQFSNLMSGVNQGAVPGSQSIIRALDWASMGEITVVDVGGNAGHIAMAVAKEFPRVTAIVQDLPDTEVKFEELISRTPDLRSRVTYQPHSFFDPQPTRADVYILRCILHDWPDKQCIKIIKELTKTLKPNGRILVGDMMLPEFDQVPMALMHQLCGIDMEMMMYCNSKERSRKEWLALFKEADEKLVIKSEMKPVGNPVAFFSVGYEDGNLQQRN